MIEKYLLFFLGLWAISIGVQNSNVDARALPLVPAWGTGEANNPECMGVAQDQKEGITLKFYKLDGRLFFSFKISNATKLSQHAIDPTCFDPYTVWTWHLHDRAGFDSTLGLGPNTCTEDAVGGHWDPTLACGPGSGNSFCKRFPLPPSSAIPQHLTPSLREYTCTADMYFDHAAYACEVGDLTGKYFPLVVPPAGPGGTIHLAVDIYDRRDVIPSCELGDKSVVIHCGASRIFCLQLQLQQDVVDAFFDVTHTEISGVKQYREFLTQYMNVNGSSHGVVSHED